MDPSQELLGRVRRYLDGKQPHGELSEWLLKYADYFLAEPEKSFEVQLWSRALNLLCLLGDDSIDETIVRQELEALLASRQAVPETV